MRDHITTTDIDTSAPATPVTDRGLLRHVYETTNPEAALDFVNRTYARGRLRSFRREGFRFRAETTRAGSLARDGFFASGPIDSECAGLGYAATVVVRSGELEITSNGETRRFGPGDVLLHRPQTGFSARWNHLDVTMISFPLADLLATAEQAGIRPDDFRVQSLAPANPALKQHWLATLAWLDRAVDTTPEALQQPLVLAHTVKLLSAAAIATFPNNAMNADHVSGVGRTTPRAVRRAMQYMDTHAGEPVTASDVAAASGLGMRALQDAFRRYRDQSPMAYLRMVRLSRAHDDLVRANPLSDSVADIAARWGFAHGGHFAALYRERYGRLPGETLRN